MGRIVYRVGIAGYGSVGAIRHRVIDTLYDFEVVAAADQKFVAPEERPQELLCFTSYEEMLECAGLHVLFVCLPNYLAAQATIDGLEKGVHVFCEKPPGRSVEDIARVQEVERSHPTAKLMYGFNHRYHDSVMKALDVTHNGELGQLMSMRGVYGKSKIIRFDSDWRTKRELAGGGILLDQGIHMVDMFRLFGGEYKDVHSFISNSFWEHDVEDNAFALLRAQNGVVAMLHSSATQWRHTFSLQMNFSRGAMNLAGILSSTRSYAPETIEIVEVDPAAQEEKVQTVIQYNEDHSWKREVEEFATNILEKKPVTKGTSDDAYKTMKWVFEIYRADSTWLCN